MRPPRILVTTDAVGGVWQYAAELCAALPPMGVEVVLACLGPSPDAVRRAAVAALPGVTFVDTGLDLDWLAPDAAALHAAGAALARLASAEAVSLVHCNQPAMATAEFAVPVVAAIHSCVATWWQAVRGGALPEAFRWQTEAVARGLRRADAVVAPSRAFAAAVARTYDLAREPEVVANGRAPTRGGAAPADSPSGDFAFTAGRLWDEGKGAAVLDRVASRLGAPLRAAGPVRGPNGESVALRHVEALGALDDAALASQLAARPVFVSAARYEPFGLAVLEAAQAGCLLVLSDIATFRELWDGAALFVPCGDDAGFADAIAALLADRDARSLWADRARERAAPYTPDRTASAMAAIYRRVLGRDLRAAAA